MFPTSDWADGSRQQRHYPIAPDSLLARLTQHPSRQKLNMQVKHVFTHFYAVFRGGNGAGAA